MEGGGGGGKRSLARSLHIYKLAFQSCRYTASQAENIQVFFFLIQGIKDKQNTVSRISISGLFGSYLTLKVAPLLRYSIQRSFTNS